jgi:hypothetical protein
MRAKVSPGDLEANWRFWPGHPETQRLRRKAAADCPSALCCRPVRTDARRVCALILVLGGGSGACLSGDSAGASRLPPATPAPATIQQLMAGQVDPAADALWDSVATIVSAAGIEERRPRTAAEWRAVRQQALTLIKATRLLESPGRRVADKVTAPGPGELSVTEIQRRIDANHQSFVAFASGLRTAAQQALAAIVARDPQRLMDAGGVIDSACEACHLAYWYPMPDRAGTVTKTKP